MLGSIFFFFFMQPSAGCGKTMVHFTVIPVRDRLTRSLILYKRRDLQQSTMSLLLLLAGQFFRRLVCSLLRCSMHRMHRVDSALKALQRPSSRRIYTRVYIIYRLSLCTIYKWLVMGYSGIQFSMMKCISIIMQLELGCH